MTLQIFRDKGYYIFSDDVDKIAKVIQDEFEVDEVNSVDKRDTRS